MSGGDGDAAGLLLPIQEMSNQEGVVSGAGKFHDGIKFTIVTNEANFHHAICKHAATEH